MIKNEKTMFSPNVAKMLNIYVYRLIDPRNGETFYVGRGQGNRVFDHIHELIDSNDPSDKMKKIREIHVAGFEVAHVIHRHGMDLKTAIEVEAALIDAYPGLSNIVSGFGSNDYGTMHAKEIIRRYEASVADFQHKALLICVNRSALEYSIYDATRYAWKIDIKKASKADVILSTVQGLIVGAFVADNWLPATQENFPGHVEMQNRFGFIGHEATPELRQAYVGKRIPDSYRKRGAAFPIRYTW